MGVTWISGVYSFHSKIDSVCLVWKPDAQQRVEPLMLLERYFLVLVKEMAVRGCLEGSQKLLHQHLLSSSHDHILAAQQI